MRFWILILIAGLSLAVPAQAQAQAPRDVLLEVCNQTGFAVAAAAAYRTTPSEARTLRTWFLIAPGQCLNGALNGVIGDDLDLHVMSGSWTWPANETRTDYCVPAAATLTLATAPPCSPEKQPRAFIRLPVETTNHRGPGGRNFGRVGYQVRCEGLSGGDAALCPGAPTDARGMAAFVHELEVCNNGSRPAQAAAGHTRTDGGLEFDAWNEIAGGTCEVIYRGFPQGNHVLYAQRGDRSSSSTLICTADTAEGLATPRASLREACPAERPQPATYETVEFGPQTGRVTMFTE
ncbi:hypothetical protein [uncultured Maricaulis sp.]|uniref:hypothetical protein n=1 Tax=uncultured Maricaulis sp. TaxID=174710 RepID=UPI0030D7064F|tara:strand:+ start:4040 stop:4915 length:876 start_codon:yes stop_codon:yes gene_type:complete